ncbi:MAG TPA: metalloregulator ArsR/SmtB family transcription factor [Gaiellaceae bacterium]|nr:metalloregulator ArsR/SmtB family transcription factor [Gaiellaceae bacterium]
MTTQTPNPARIASLRALADPVRLALVDELAHEDACACELRARLDLSAPLMSHHLKVLREAGLVSCEKVGRRVEVSLDREALARVAGSLGAA